MKNNVNVLHISDIHFGMESSTETTMIAHRENALNELLRTLSILKKEDKPDIVVISGDIAWQGKDDAYNIAKKWILELLAALELSTQQLVICAGNHDINRNKAMGISPPSTSKDADKWLSIENLENFMRPFSAFEKFCEDLGIPKLSISNLESNLIGQREITGIKFIVLNSAWFCRGDQDRGNLWIGLPQLELMQAKKQILHPDEFDKGIISIAVVHHPINWLNDEEQSTYDPRPSTYRYLSERTHLILSGHVHGAIENATRSFDRSYIIIGGAAYSGGRYRNNFSILKIDKETRDCIQIPFEFDPRNTKWEKKQEKKLFLDIEQERREEKSTELQPKNILTSSPRVKIPYRSHPFFTGRNSILNTLKEEFFSKKIGTEKVLCGMGGIGKTQIAVEFALQFQRNYDVIWWIRAENETLLLSDLEELCKELDLPIKDVDNKLIVFDVLKNWMQTNQKWLLIFDNVNDPEHIYKYLPANHQGNILITSRNEGRRNSIPIRELSVENSELFLVNSTGLEDIKSAKELALELGNLPLALEQASAYIQQSGLTLHEYLERFKFHKIEIIGKGEALNYKETVLTTWEISLNEVSKKIRKCKDFMLFCAFLSPTMIPKTLFIRNKEILPKFLRGQGLNILDLDNIFIQLRNFSLIQVEQGTFSVHPLLQTVIVSELTQEEKGYWVEQVLELLEKHSKYFVKELGFEPVVSHLIKILEHAHEINYISESVVHIAEMLSKLFFEFGNYDVAIQFGERAVRVSEKVTPFSDLLASTVYHNMGVVLCKTSELHKAKEYVEKALLPESLSIEDRINYLNTLANIELDLGYVEKAHSLIFESKRLYDEISEEIEDQTLIEPILNSLAQVLIEQGHFEEAEDILLKNIETLKEKGLDHFPIIAAVYSNLATTWLERGGYEKAKSFFKNALEVYINLFTEDHPRVAQEYNNLGLAYFYNYEFFHAKRFFRKGLELNEKLYQNHNSNIYLAKNYNNLGMALEMLENKELALKYYKKSLDIYGNLFGYDYPSAASTFYNIGNLFYLKKDFKRAIENLEKALEIDKKFNGENHLEVGKDLGKLGAIFIDAEDLETAECYSLKALNIFQTFIPNSMDVSSIHLNLSILYIKKNKLISSRQHIQESLAIALDNYGGNHKQINMVVKTYFHYLKQNNLINKERSFIQTLQRKYNLNLNVIFNN